MRSVALKDPHDQGGDAYVSAGTYFMHHVVTENHFPTTPVIGTLIFIFPGDALVELATGLVLDRFDDREPTFTPALAQAARDLADARLTDAELSPATIAAQLHVSVRTFDTSTVRTPP